MCLNGLNKIFCRMYVTKLLVHIVFHTIFFNTFHIDVNVDQQLFGYQPFLTLFFHVKQNK